MVYATAVLFKDGCPLRKGDVKLKEQYSIVDNQADDWGKHLRVIAGPHADYDDVHVFTVDLMSPVEWLEKQLPFFNSHVEGAFEYMNIHIA